MASRFDLFHSLDKEKQKNIIDSALAEFAEKGFKRASTNIIAQNAKIGKGMLFYYFGTKEELFDFLCEYVIEYVKNTYVMRFNTETDDFIERYQIMAQLKREAMAEYSLPFEFYKGFFLAENAEYFEKHKTETTELREQVFDKMYGDIDYSLFRGDIEHKSAIKYIKWMFESYENSLIEKVKRGEIDVTDKNTNEKLWEEFYGFIRDLKKMFYK